MGKELFVLSISYCSNTGGGAGPFASLVSSALPSVRGWGGSCGCLFFSSSFVSSSRLRRPADVRFLTAFANCPSCANCSVFLLMSRAKGVTSWTVFFGAWVVLMGLAELSASLNKFSQSPLRARVRREESHSPARNALFLDLLLFLGGRRSNSLASAKSKIHLASLSGSVVIAFKVLCSVSPHALLQLLGQCLRVGIGLVITTAVCLGWVVPRGLLGPVHGLSSWKFLAIWTVAGQACPSGVTAADTRARCLFRLP